MGFNQDLNHFHSTPLMQLIISALVFFCSSWTRSSDHYCHPQIPSNSTSVFTLNEATHHITVEVYVSMTYLETTFVPGSETNSFQKSESARKWCVLLKIFFFLQSTEICAILYYPSENVFKGPMTCHQV